MSGRLLFVSMYSLAEGNTGPTVRARRLLASLRTLTSVEVIAGYRGPRRRSWVAFLLSGRLRGVDAVYVESSTALPSELDIAALVLAKALGRPVVTYVRDAYQLFPETYPAHTLRQRFSRRAFRLAIWLLRSSSTHLAFPSAGLARIVEPGGDAPLLIPPGAPEPADIIARARAHSLLFVGDLRVPAQGGATLIEAVSLARRRGAGVDLLCVTPDGGDPPLPHPPWLRIVRASSETIGPLLREVIATVIPRAASAYNDLAVPIKLMEYLAYGRPIIATDVRETAAIVRGAGCGVVVPATADGIADGIDEILTASPQQRRAWARAATTAAIANSWAVRAHRILELLGISAGETASTPGS